MQCLPGYAGHGTGYGGAYQLADATVLIDPGGAMGVRVVGFALYHDAGLVPAAAGHVARLTAANHLREVFLAAEEDFNIFVQTTATVEAGVDNDAFTVVVFTQNVAIDGAEAGVGHRLDVDVAQSASRPARYIGGTLFHPAGVEQVAHLTIADGQYDLVPAFAILRVIERDKGLAAHLVEQTG